jgi:diguanylate cyclase (GGDEF)-like protein
MSQTMARTSIRAVAAPKPGSDFGGAAPGDGAANRRRIKLLALSAALLGGLLLAAALIAFFVLTTLPAYAECARGACTARDTLTAIGIVWLSFLPVLGVGVVLATIGVEWVLRRRAAADRRAALGGNVPPGNASELQLEVMQLRAALDNERVSREQADARAEFALTHDSLTGLVNRSRVHQLITAAIERGQQDATGVALFFLDFDDFKNINDTHGHVAGDQFLRLVGDRLRRALDCDDCIARMGGDEFVVFSEGVDDRKHAESIAQALLSEVAKPCVIAGKDVVVTTSIGVSLFPQDAQDAHTLIHFADRAMYTAKQHGRDTYVFFSQ